MADFVSNDVIVKLTAPLMAVPLAALLKPLGATRCSQGSLFCHFLTAFIDQTRLSLVTTVNMQAAKTHLSRLVEQAIAGEEIVIARAGKPLVRLTPFVPDQSPRTLGLMRGQIREASDCWETDPAMEAAFEEGTLLPS